MLGIRLKECLLQGYHNSGAGPCPRNWGQAGTTGADSSTAAPGPQGVGWGSQTVTDNALQQKNLYTLVVPYGTLCQGSSVNLRQGWVVGTGFLASSLGAAWKASGGGGWTKGTMATRASLGMSLTRLQGRTFPLESWLACSGHLPPAGGG